MNKIVSIKERVLVSLVVPSRSGNSQEFPSRSGKPLYGQMQRKNLKFIKRVDFELIENLPNNGTKYLLIFVDSC